MAVREALERLPASGPVKHGPNAGSFYVASVQRNPHTEVPEAPSTKNRIEDRNGGVAAIIARPEVALCLGYAAVRPIPPVVPTTGRRRTVPATRRRRPVPVRRRPTGRRPIIPAEPSRWRRRRPAVVACAEAARRIRGATHLGITPIVSALRHRSARPRSLPRPLSRSARSRPLSRSARSRPLSRPLSRSARSRPLSRSARSRPLSRSARSRPLSRPLSRSARSRPLSRSGSRSVPAPVRAPPGPGPPGPGPPGPGPCAQDPVRQDPAQAAQEAQDPVRQVLARQGPARATVRQDSVRSSHKAGMASTGRRWPALRLLSVLTCRHPRQSPRRPRASHTCAFVPSQLRLRQCLATP